MTKIIEIESIQILDSRANPTLLVELLLEDGSKGSFQVPSGASTGIHEAHELRDKDKTCYGGKSVYKALQNIESIKGELIGKEFTQQEFDKKLIELDGTPNKEKLGANAILGLSIAFARASAAQYMLPLVEYLKRLAKGEDMTKPSEGSSEEVQIHPFANIINGGLHSGNDLNIQEFMVLPTFGTFEEKTRAIAEIYHTLKALIEKEYGKSQTAVGDEGGFAPEIAKARQALDLIMKAIQETGYEGRVKLAMDTAASDFYSSETKKYEVEAGLFLDYKELTAYYNDLVNSYPIISIEDPFAEDDFEAFAYFMKNAAKVENNPLTGNDTLLIVGDDLLVTNPKRIEMAKKAGACNALLLKINQIGTLTESIEAHLMAKKASWHTIVSHRSGETTDAFISDLALALGSSIKLGAPARGERAVKYNRLLQLYAKKCLQ
ncbi:MAG: phosphopyruvate hydratase [Candidatus Woesearchaeota archaeon]|nr:MAG: phosphopyruvate hydratase [Candidatus Woesearchaeota archaeon]